MTVDQALKAIGKRHKESKNTILFRDRVFMLIKH